MNIGFIGAGKVGYSLGKYLSVNGIGLSGYYSRNLNSAEEAAEFTGTKAFTTLEELLRESTVIFITVPDGAITDVFNNIRELGISGKLICHCSGALSAGEAFPDPRRSLGRKLPCQCGRPGSPDRSRRVCRLC